MHKHSQIAIVNMQPAHWFVLYDEAGHFALDMNYAFYISENCSKNFDDNGYRIVVHIRSLGYLAWVHLVPSQAS